MRREWVLPFCWGALELHATVAEAEGQMLMEEEFDSFLGMCLDCMTEQKPRS